MMIADEVMASADALKTVCTSIANVEVTGTVRSASMLVARLKRRDADLLLVDVAGELGGLDTIDAVKQVCPGLDMLLMYHPDRCGKKRLVQALEMGISECIDKTCLDHDRTRQEFRLHLLTLIGLLQSRKRFSKKQPYKNKFFIPRVARPEPAPGPERIRKKPFKADIVAIASSTGGPEILSRIFSLLPADLGVPILLVQHMPKGMTRYFAENLDMRSELRVGVASDGQELLPSAVYVAPAGTHMTVSPKDGLNRRFIRLTDDPPVNSVKPSADTLFRSVARSYDRNILAVVLTGMGEDGKDGVRSLKEKSCICLTQAAETCVVYGMPRVVVEAGLSDKQLDPIGLTRRIALWSRGRH